MPNGGTPAPDRGDHLARITKARRGRTLRWVFWIIGGALLIGLFIYALSRGRGEDGGGPGQLFPDQGRPHVALGAPFAYNSNPPTSGPHYSVPAEWGVYEREISDQVLIHNLEHGGIWISYRPGTASSTVDTLSAIAKEFGRKVIMTPRAANDADIALAAWGRLDTFSAAEFSADRVRAFVRAWRNKGPEFVP